jgi:hypothetical protein
MTQEELLRRASLLALPLAILCASAMASEQPVVCKPESLPTEIQHHLKGEYSSWKIQEPADLSPRAHDRWESEKPIDCPGIAMGKFESDGTPSYAVLLVPVRHTDSGHRFLVFSRKENQTSYEMRIVDQSDVGGGSSFFIHSTRISKFFDDRSRKKFRAGMSDGILLVDSAENEYGVDIYFWAGDSYHHEPVDY